MKRLAAAVALVWLWGCDDFDGLSAGARCRADVTQCDAGGPPPDDAGSDAGSDAGFDAGTADASVPDGGSGFYRRDGGPTLNDGLFVPEEFVTRGDAGVDCRGTAVAALGADVAWTWSHGASTGTLEVVRGDGGVELRPLPFLPTALSADLSVLTAAGLYAANDLAVFGDGGVAPSSLTKLAPGLNARALITFAAGGRKGLLLADGYAGEAVRGVRFNLDDPGMRVGFTLCSHGHISSVAASPAAIYVVFEGDNGACTMTALDAGLPLDGGNALFKLQYDGEPLAAVDLVGSGSVAVTPDGDLWLARSDYPRNSVERRDPQSLAPIGPSFDFNGSTNLGPLVATPAGVFYVGTSNGSELTYDGGTISAFPGQMTLVIQLDPATARLTRFGILNSADSSPNAAAWVDGRLVVTGSCAGTQDGGPGRRAYLMGINP